MNSLDILASVASSLISNTPKEAMWILLPNNPEPVMVYTGETIK